MRSFFPKILVTLLATSLKVAVAVCTAIGRQLGRAIAPAGRLLFALALPVFGGLVSVKRLVIRLMTPPVKHSRIVHLFTRRYVFHLTFVGLAVTVVATNLNAYEVKRDELAYSNIFASLAANDELAEIEAVEPPPTPAVKRYYGATALEPSPRIVPGAPEQELEPGTIAGGSAVVKPIRLSSGVTVAELPAGIPRSDVITYDVQEGDTISGIAAKFGISINTVLWENNLTPYAIIRPGQALTILPISGVRHKVVRGENLSKIAAAYGVETADIIAANRLASADDLQIGEPLLIPGGKKPRPAPSYALRRPNAPAPAGGGRLSWPATCRRITQYFSWRHTGIDIACSYGSTVYAAEAGRVIKAQGGWNGGYGIMVVVQHADGTQTVYGHNSKLFVQIGEDVARGQTIASLGSTGRSTGPHLHFEVRSGGYRKNPFSYLR